jgi:hypothetical protein
VPADISLKRGIKEFKGFKRRESNPAVKKSGFYLEDRVRYNKKI